MLFPFLFCVAAYILSYCNFRNFYLYLCQTHFANVNLIADSVEKTKNAMKNTSPGVCLADGYAI